MRTDVDETMIGAFYAASTVHARRLRYPTDLDFDDLVQEGVIGAWRAVVERDLDDPLTYGKVVAGRRAVEVSTGKIPMFGNKFDNVAYDPYRRRDEKIEDLPDDVACTVVDRDPTPEDVAVGSALVDRVVEVVGGMSRDDQALTVMVALGYTFPEISTALGKQTRSWAMNRWYAGRRPLRRRLHDALLAEVTEDV